MAGKRTVGLLDVALDAGVHPSTASRALSPSSDRPVNEATRARVLASALRLGYQPNALARGLKMSATGSIGMMVPSLRNPAWSEVTRAAFHRAWQLGYVLVLVEDRAETETEAAHARLVAQGRIDGLIVASARPDSRAHANLQARSKACVYVGRRMPGSGRNVTLDEEAVGRMAAQHLIDLGHTQLAHISGDATNDVTWRRVIGFDEACRSAGVSSFTVCESLDEVGGERAMVGLLAGPMRPTGVFITNFNQAFGAIAATRSADLSIPKDISVVSCDDDPVLSYLDPPLTAIRRPLAELGEAAVEAVVAQIEGKGALDVRVSTTADLIVRSSTAYR